VCPPAPLALLRVGPPSSSSTAASRSRRHCAALPSPPTSQHFRNFNFALTCKHADANLFHHGERFKREADTDSADLAFSRARSLFTLNFNSLSFSFPSLFSSAARCASRFTVLRNSRGPGCEGNRKPQGTRRCSRGERWLKNIAE